MKIYTYYENIKFKQQNELLKLWEMSWKKMGFEPIILGLKDAKKSSKYSEFCEKMRLIFKKITNKNLSSYGLSCFIRWLAYSTVENKEERFFVSDYDVFNSGKWKTSHPIKNKLHFYDSACPCLASGNAQEFGQLCDAFFDVTMKRLDVLQAKASHYHDQEFFMYNFMPQENVNAEELWVKYDIFFSKRRCEDVAPFGTDCDEKVRAFHVSHNNTKMVKDKNPEKYQNLSLDEVRIKIAKNILNIHE